MRLLIIHTAYKFKGGEDTVVANEMALLATNGVEVELLQFSNEGNTLLKVLSLPFNVSSYFKTLQKLRSFQPDVVHIHNLHFGGSPTVMYALKRRNVPFVVTLHNYRLLCPSATLYANGKMFTESVNKTFSWKAIKKGVYQHSKLLTFWVSCSMLLHQKLGTYKLASKYIALGAHTKEIFKNSKLSAIADRIVIKPNFCYNESDFNPSSGEYYVYIGRLSEEKGVETLLKAFVENGLPLKIAGTGELKEEVIKYCSRYPNISYLGVMSKNATGQLIARAKALIFPSQWYETFGMVVIEAFSKSVPVIASDLGQLKSTIQNGVNGLLFDAGNPEDLTQKVVCYDSLPEEGKCEFRKAAFNSYNRLYNPQVNASQLIDIYDSVLPAH